MVINFFLSCHIILAEVLCFIYDPLYHLLGYNGLGFFEGFF